MDNKEIAKTMENILIVFNEALESRNAIQRVREVTNQYIEHGDFVEKETALDILKALDGEQ